MYFMTGGQRYMIYNIEIYGDGYSLEERKKGISIAVVMESFFCGYK